jgi:hypothetical protein
MPEVIETLVYQIAELAPKARDKARSWYREAAFDHDWWDAVYEDFEEICDILGVQIKSVPVRLMGGGIRMRPCIWFSGFWSQGDGSCFEGWYAHAKGAPVRIRAHAPKDAELHRIADTLQDIQRRNFFQLRAVLTHRGRYYHANCLEAVVERDSLYWQAMTEGAEGTMIEALRDLARWLYRQLEAEYDALTSDDAVDEAIEANEYTFTAAGASVD